jgi:beta-lactamase superfamily II metal-dependent hydrolase
MFRIEMLEANEGDALWIEYGDPAQPRRILIDCGYKSTYRNVMKRFDSDPDLELELFVLTHIDSDHIAGAVPFIADRRVTPAKVKDVWFNSRSHLTDHMGVEQAVYFTHYLKDRGFAWNKAFDEFAVAIEDGKPLPVRTLPGGLKLTLLSPTRQKLRELALAWDPLLEEVMNRRGVDSEEELVGLDDPRLAADDHLGDIDVDSLASKPFVADDKEPNGSSIAFLAEYEDAFDGGRKKSVLFLGDAHSPVVEESVRRVLQDRGGAARLKIDALKLSHHGSKKNTSKDLLDLLNCEHFLFSTNGSKHKHPDQECVARVVVDKRPCQLYFNYETIRNDMWKDATLQGDFNYTAHYPVAGKPGLVVSI